jgi:outer membrane protein OmpA-like peptidoglycan-associated protein
MKGYKAILLGGVCLGILAVSASAGNATSSANTPAWAAEATMNPDYDGTVLPQGAAEPSSPVDTSTTMEIAPPGDAPTGVAGVTSFYGDTAPSGTPAWAEEAKLNPDYSAEPAAAAAGETEAPAAASEAPPAAAESVAAADPGEAPAGVPGVTSYYGITAPSSPPAWAAEAAMNPDYSADSPAPAAAASEAATAEAVVPADPGEAPKGVPGVTSFYGDTAPAGTPAWAAEATMNPDYNAASSQAAAAAPAKQEAVEACRDSLNAEAKSGIVFASNKWDVLASSYKALDRIAKAAKDCGESFVIEIGGHTDNVGQEAVNQRISEMRANAVLSYLTGKGVPSSKLKAVGYGQAKPVAENTTPQGRAKNRRIEFVVTTN